MSSTSEPKAVYKLSWEELAEMCGDLAAKAQTLGTFTGVLGVARGGLVPAALVARHMGLRLMDTLCVQSYEGKVRGDIKILRAPDHDGSGWLLVDDIADTGHTLEHLRGIYPGIKVATVFAKDRGMPHTDVYATKVAQDTWVSFPWESIDEGS